MIKKIAIIDNSFPVLGDIIIGENKFQELIKLSNSEWREEVSLKSLIVKLVNLSIYKNKKIEVLGFLHPEKLIDEIKENDYHPDIIIYDWEYDIGSEDSETNLLSILNSIETFAFVYSSYFEDIPPSLNKSDFDRVANKIYLLSKGDKERSIFSSEEYIVQYILSLFDKNIEFDLNDSAIKFIASKYLSKAKDIVYLELILGRDFILQKLKEIHYEISKETIEYLFSIVNKNLYKSKDNKFIIFQNNEIMKNKFGHLDEVSYLDALKIIGIKGIDTVLNSGIKYIE